MVMNKSLQVCIMLSGGLPGTDSHLGGQHTEHERRAGGTDVQELPVQCSFPSGRYGSIEQAA